MNSSAVICIDVMDVMHEFIIGIDFDGCSITIINKIFRLVF